MKAMTSWNRYLLLVVVCLTMFSTATRVKAACMPEIVSGCAYCWIIHPENRSVLGKTNYRWDEVFNFDVYQYIGSQWLFMGTGQYNGVGFAPIDSNGEMKNQEGLSSVIRPGTPTVVGTWIDGYYRQSEVGTSATYTNTSNSGYYGTYHPDCDPSDMLIGSKNIRDLRVIPTIRMPYPSRLTVTRNGSPVNGLSSRVHLGNEIEFVSGTYSTNSQGVVSYSFPVDGQYRKIAVLSNGFWFEGPSMDSSYTTSNNSTLALPASATYTFRSAGGVALKNIVTQVYNTTFTKKNDVDLTTNTNGLVSYSIPANFDSSVYLAAGSAAFGPVQRETNATFTVAVPLLNTPANGSVWSGSTMNFSWQSLSSFPNHAGYLFLLLQNGNVIFNTQVTTPNVQISGFAPGTYEWVVAPYNTNFQIYDESYSSTFTIQATTTSLNANMIPLTEAAGAPDVAISIDGPVDVESLATVELGGIHSKVEMPSFDITFTSQLNPELQKFVEQGLKQAKENNVKAIDKGNIKKQIIEADSLVESEGTFNQ